MLISLAVNQNIYHCKRFKKLNWKRKSNKFVSLYRSPIKTHAKIFIITVATVKCYHARLETDHSNLYTLNIKIWTKSNQNKNQTNLYPFIVLLQNTHTYIYVLISVTLSSRYVWSYHASVKCFAMLCLHVTVINSHRNDKSKRDVDTMLVQKQNCMTS